MPRTAQKTYVNGIVVKVTAIEEDATHRTWAWIVAPKLRDPIEGKLKALKSKPAGVILMSVSEIMSNPNSAHLPAEWADTMERRFMWSEVLAEIKAIQKELHGFPKIAH